MLGLLAVLAIGIMIVPAYASQACTLHGPEGVWDAYDNIYTGKVIAHTVDEPKSNLQTDGNDNSTTNVVHTNVKIDFKLEHVLKGNPPHQWSRNVPLETFCPAIDCISGADHFTVDSEIFYITGHNGGNYSFSGACGIGVLKVDESFWQTAQGFFKHYEELYEDSPPTYPYSPYKQMKLGYPIDESKCDTDKILMKSKSGKPSCLYENTAAKLADRGFSIVIPKEKIVDVSAKPQVTGFQIASSEPFVDDGREFKIVKRPYQHSPINIYDKIMGYDLVIGNDDASGFARFTSLPHEKYSIHEGEGLYVEDWMPTHIIPGYKLLYANSGYNYPSFVYYRTISDEFIYSAEMYYVPNDFVLHANVTDVSLNREVGGYSIVAKTSIYPHDDIKNIMKEYKDSMASKNGDYTVFKNYTLNGHTVYAHQGGNDSNYYTARITFAPDQFTLVYVESNYHTIDELIPVFESIIN